jgi:hypothetical protein
MRVLKFLVVRGTSLMFFFVMYYYESKAFHPEYLALTVLLGQAGKFLTNCHEKITKCVGNSMRYRTTTPYRACSDYTMTPRHVAQ